MPRSKHKKQSLSGETVRATITIAQRQWEWADENDINLSSIVREAIEMEKHREERPLSRDARRALMPVHIDNHRITVTLLKEQKEWVKLNHYNLSSLAREAIEAERRLVGG